MALPQNWAQAILRGIGAPVTPQNLRFLAAWQRAEGGGTANNANWNPLNTTQPAGGAGSINSVGVRSYRSADQGIRATVATLLNGHYGDIVSGLRSGRASAEQLAHSGGLSTWGTGSGVLRVLGAGGNLSPAKGTASSPALDLARKLGGPHQTAQAQGDAFKKEVGSFLLQNAQALASGQRIDPTSILSLALARQTAAQPSPQAQSLAGKVGGGARAAVAYPSGRIKFEGKPLSGEKQDFISKLSAAVSSVGGTRIRVISGYRSPAYNRAIGGAPNSNHTTGNAMDGEALINGRWVPLGTALRSAAPKFGLRSGDAAGFFHGTTDPNHVDNAANQR